ncbi:protein scarlet-like [Arctopsyche grandis]|uniref:protein scarlet-like n=1 Tax=Arctopsyche grandis TaxID=121162 RepID=UPI00406DA086
MNEMQALNINPIIKRRTNLSESINNPVNNNEKPPKDSFNLSWNNLNMHLHKKVSSKFWKKSCHKKVQILENVTGNVNSGDLLAIMGPSGSGKTTLLASISMRVQGEFSGSLLLNGRPVTKMFLTNMSGFVPQLDLAFEMLTVSEHMEFMARMKMDKHSKDDDRKKCITRLLIKLGIIKCINTKLSSLSGGERKRLSLAVQMINDPPLLFCDEPTTGLDSWSAASVIDQLRLLASSGKAIVCSIHQPASGIFDLFHKVLLLSGGKVAFHGLVKEATIFFRKQGFEAPVGYNEAEFLVSIISVENTAQKVCSAWSNKKKMNQKNIGNACVANNHNLNSFSEKVGMEYKHYCLIENPGIFTQLYWLIWRSLIAARRDNKIWLIEFLALMGIAIIVALPYMNILVNIDQKDVQNVQGLMYLIVTEIIFTFVYSVFNNFPPEISILLRELANGLYTPGPYYISKMLLMIPRAIIETFLYTSIIFWVVGLDNKWNTFFLFTIPVILAANCANAYGTWLSATFESIATASLVSVPIDLISYSFAGTFLNLASIPNYLSWIKYLSIFFYSSEAISILQWEGVTNIKCDSREGLPCIATGAEVIDYLGYNINNYYKDLLGMLGIYIMFHILGYLSLVKRSKKQPVY